MPAIVTITGKTGVALSMTAKSFAEVREAHIHFDKNMITLERGGEIVSPIDIGPATTVVATKVGNVWSLTIS